VPESFAREGRQNRQCFLVLACPLFSGLKSRNIKRLVPDLFSSRAEHQSILWIVSLLLGLYSEKQRDFSPLFRCSAF